ncbi:MAG: glycosyltransferase [Pirellulales bacterium]|nr:glycosyltransferase [Pirellulales bacterium]
MRILLTNHLPLHGSESGAFTRDLAVGLERAGHQVRALVVDEREAGDEPFHVRRIVCRGGETSADLPFALPSFSAPTPSRQSFDTLSDDQLAQYREELRRHLDEEIAEFDPHVIHAQHIGILGHLALEAGVPYVLGATGADLLSFQADDRYRRFAEEAAENAGRILAASERIRRQVLATFDVADERAETLAKAIDLRPYESPPTRAMALARIGLPLPVGPLVTFVGRLAAHKGIDTLLNAAAVYESHPARPTTLIVGDGIQRVELEAQARRLGLERVRLVGEQPPAFCVAAYVAADLVVLPSRGDTSGRVALEALATGTPVLAAAAGSLTEIVDDQTGGLVPTDDHELLAAGVMRAIDEDWKRTKGPAAGARVRKHYNIDDRVPWIVERYERAVADRGGRVT